MSWIISFTRQKIREIIGLFFTKEKSLLLSNKCWKIELEEKNCHGNNAKFWVYADCLNLLSWATISPQQKRYWTKNKRVTFHNLSEYFCWQFGTKLEYLHPNWDNLSAGLSKHLFVGYIQLCNFVCCQYGQKKLDLIDLDQYWTKNRHHFLGLCTSDPWL